MICFNLVPLAALAGPTNTAIALLTVFKIAAFVSLRPMLLANLPGRPSRFRLANRGRRGGPFPAHHSLKLAISLFLQNINQLCLALLFQLAFFVLLAR